MKYIVLLGDGMAGWPLKELRNRTCLEKALTPNMDRLASLGEVGSVRTIPRGFPPGSDVANLSILGYDPAEYYCGRAPLEAAYKGIPMKRSDVAFRCNLVTLGFRERSLKNAVMIDYSADHITSREARRIMTSLNRMTSGDRITFYPGVSYRNLMIWKKGPKNTSCTPPHDISGKKINRYLPSGEGASELKDLMSRSLDILTKHPVNKARAAQGSGSANCVWFWGQGTKSSMPAYRNKYRISGALISAVDLIKGLGTAAGLEVLNVKGATGYLDTNYIGKARAALRALNRHDFVFVHVEAPDEAGHEGDINAKIRAIEDFDEKVVGTVLKGLSAFQEYSVLLLCDHFTPIRVMTHTADPVPFVLFRNGRTGVQKKGGTGVYSEAICSMRGARTFRKGHLLMDYFLQRKTV